MEKANECLSSISPPHAYLAPAYYLILEFFCLLLDPPKWSCQAIIFPCNKIKSAEDHQGQDNRNDRVLRSKGPTSKKVQTLKPALEKRVSRKLIYPGKRSPVEYLHKIPHDMKGYRQPETLRCAEHHPGYQSANSSAEHTAKCCVFISDM